MPLPHYPSSSAIEPIYSNLFEFVLVTEKYHIKELCYDLTYKNNFDVNRIHVSFAIDLVNFKYLNFDNFLKDIKCVIHVSHSKKGDPIAQFLIGVKFIKSEINFSHNDSKILEVKLELDNLSCEEINVSVDDTYIKSIQRDFKLNSLI